MQQGWYCNRLPADASIFKNGIAQRSYAQAMIDTLDGAMRKANMLLRMRDMQNSASKPFQCSEERL